jgi:putative ABC transport system permease protein
MIGRLRPGFTPQVAETELRTLSTALARIQPRVISLHEYIVGNTRREMAVLWIAVGCVLLIACVNVANLLLARSMTRTRETSVRTALGAGRGALIRAALAETSLLSLGGGAIGVLLAWAVLTYVARLREVGLPRLPDVTLDPSTIFYAAGCCAVAALLAGLGPIVSVFRVGLQPALRRSESSSSPARGLSAFHAGLAVSQIALALVLLTAAGMLIKSVYLSRYAASQADPRHVLVSRLDQGWDGGGGKIDAQDFQYEDRNREIQRRLRLLPGVRSAALHTESFSLVEKGSILEMVIEGEPPPNPRVQVGGGLVTDPFFAASGYRLVAGRLFNESDTRTNGSLSAATALVVNEKFVRIFAPALKRPQDALHRQVLLTARGQRVINGTIVGVVNDLDLRKEQAAEPRIFRSFAQAVPRLAQYARDLVVRTSGDPTEVTAKARGILASYGLRLLNPETLEDRVSAAVATRQFESMLLAAFASIALLLSTVGIYGVISYSVAQRTREIGVRIALGGQPWDVMKMVLGRGTRLTLLGVVLGLAGALALTRMMGAMINGVAPNDPWVLGGVCTSLLLIATLAAYIPARRATRVNPVEALRHE